MDHVPGSQSREDIGNADNHSVGFVAGDRGTGLMGGEEEACRDLRPFQEKLCVVGGSWTSGASLEIANAMVNVHGRRWDVGGVSQWGVAAAFRPDSWPVRQEWQDDPDAHMRPLRRLNLHPRGSGVLLPLQPLQAGSRPLDCEHSLSRHLSAQLPRGTR